MSNTIGGEKPVSVPQGYAEMAQTTLSDNRSFIVGFRDHPDTAVERILRGDDTEDLDLLVASFVLVLKGAGFEVNLEISANGDFVIEDNSEFIEVEVEQEYFNLEEEARRFTVGDRVVCIIDEDDIGLYGHAGKVVEVEDADYLGYLDVQVKFDDWRYNSAGANSWWVNSSQLKRVTTH